MIELKHINKYYKVGDFQLHVLKDVNLKIESGDFVGIMGPSGSGKSTLVNVLGFLDSDYEGEYLFEGNLISNLIDKKISAIRNKTVGFVFQEFNLIETQTIFENVQLPLLYNGQTSRKTKEIVQTTLEKVGLAEKGNQLPSQLSGGQRQRAAIARALINHPKFIIADEPTGALDTATSRNIMTILQELNQKEGVTLVMVTHDPNLLEYCTHKVEVIDGRVRKEERL
ncbi:ABC transporter ATP-binding protein [Garciella nitratireducens]|uniref:Putative ABC transport system ATP-binding protein n=1 Tax=Garciella nitratireducens DSM 15102 TaxID=1121911 RepID=A0A1T4KEA2_9FIRM|nr:ABC transporter ATP-binding protein [Garciella nitratireducens]SJZ40754.1 putative ABC transport system ATP-binding protein [Garciella nitratireducens DSM 15102]